MTKYRKCEYCDSPIKLVKKYKIDDAGFELIEWESFDDDGSDMPHLCENRARPRKAE